MAVSKTSTRVRRRRVRAPRYLYRIIPFTYAVEMFERRELSMACPSSWEDPYEALSEFSDPLAFFAQCWCKDSVSDAMWRIYSPDRQSVRIKVSRLNLNMQVRAGLLQQQGRFQLHMGEVEYLKTDEFQKRLALLRNDGRADPVSGLLSFFVK